MDLIYTVADWIFVALLVVAAIFIIWGAIEFITSGGAPEKVGSARNKLIWALVGVVVAFIARGLVVLITQVIA
jgi:FtsH-binding integral membrane protein